jgi:spermidine synthase
MPVIGERVKHNSPRSAKRVPEKYKHFQVDSTRLMPYGNHALDGRFVKRRNATLLHAAVFASGVSALIFQTLWFRQAGLAFGNSVWASSLVLSSFMGGLALGNGLAGRYGDRLRNPIRVYGIAEGVVALAGCALVYLFPLLGAVVAPGLRPLLDDPWILNPLRLLIAFLALLIPSSAMGFTLPLLTKTLTSRPRQFGAVLGSLYGWNTFGAVIGVVVGELYLIRILGVRGTALSAGVLNLLIAAVAMRLSTESPQPSAPRKPARLEVLPRSAGRSWLAVAFLSGFCLLALEVAWFRLLLMFVMGHSTAFAVMLAVVLTGIAVGGLVASGWLRFSPDADQWTAPLLVGAGVLSIAAYTAFPAIVRPFENQQIHRITEILAVSWPLMLPVSLFSGVIFTLTGAALRRDRGSEIEATGELTLANTAGAALGSLIGGFVLLPVLGRENSFVGIALLYGAAGVLLMLTTPIPRRFITGALAVVLLLGVAWLPSRAVGERLLDLPAKRFAALRRSGAGDVPRVEAVRDGLTETIMYFQVPIFGRPLFHAIFMNSIPMADTQYVSRRYMKLYVYWPMAVHRNLKRSLLIAYGIGNTAKAMTDSKRLETIDVVDISRDILAMSDVVYPEKADNPLEDPRVRVHVEDGRYFLQTTAQRFDLITSEPPPPHSVGVVNLYTREYFQLLHDRLADGGIVTYWLPLHALSEVSTKAILRAFCDAFEDCSLWHGIGTELMMVGTRNAQGPVTEEEFVRQWDDPITGPEMRRLGFEGPEQLGALFIGDADYLKTVIGDARPLVDDTPKLIEAPLESQSEAERLFRSFSDEAGARERFRRSELITASLPYFAVQEIINRHAYGQPPVMENTHRLLTGSALRTLVLWLLGSDSDVQRLVANSSPSELDSAPMQLHLGISFISARNYAAAIEPLARAELDSSLHSKAFALRIYALCMSGRTDEAQRAVHERVTQELHEKRLAPESLTDANLLSFWPWMKHTFGIERR